MSKINLKPKHYNTYGDDETEFDCHNLFEQMANDIEDNSIDIQTILRYLIEKTDFADWIDKTFHNIEECDCDNCEFGFLNDLDDDFEYDDYEQVDIFNAQAELLKNTQEELKELKKKYNKLLRKYKGLSE